MDAEPFTLRISTDSSMLMAQARGPAGLPELIGVFDAVAEIGRRGNHRLCCLDLLGVDIGFGFTSHLELGMHAARTLAHFERVVSVVPERYRTGSSEKAAQKMGLRLRTFTSLEQGLAWVRTGDTPTGR